jgi:polyphenol oxidase
MNDFIYPEWSAPRQVHTVSTCRLAGYSKSPYNSFNLAQHVGDNAHHVEQNRQKLIHDACLPNSPLWLQQTHSCRVIEASAWQPDIEADGCIARQSGEVCVVMTADCLPVLIADKHGQVVAAVHAGWRGLCDGILEQTVKQMAVAPEQLLVWFGPAIGSAVFEVGDEVRQAFLTKNPELSWAFKPTSANHWLADLVQIAKARLRLVGVNSFYGGQWCSFTDQRFYSYRRDRQTGRMASLIWVA